MRSFGGVITRQSQERARHVFDYRVQLEQDQSVRSIKAVVNTVGGLLASRRVFCWLPFIFLFLMDKLRRKHPLKHANEKKLARNAALYK